MTYSAYKEFVDARGVTQVHQFTTKPKLVGPRQYSYVIEDLMPFTTYFVNVTAVPAAKEYRPPARITVTTQMAGETDFFSGTLFSRKFYLKNFNIKNINIEEH